MVCKEGNDCPEKVTLNRDDSLLWTSFTSSSILDMCTDYSLHIKPIWDGMELYEKVISFRTLSPPLSELTTDLSVSSVIMSSEQMVVIRWSSVPCARQYTVWTRDNDLHHADGDMSDNGVSWSVVGVTSKTYFQHSTQPCTEYQYGVSVSIGDQSSGIVSLDSSLVTNIDTSIVYSPPHISINTSEAGAELSWSHRKCINSYRVRSCSQDSATCYESTVITNSSLVSHSLRDLRACSVYTVTIVPSTSETGEVTAQPMTLTTLPPAASPPARVQVNLDTPGDKVDISWPQVECATGYR